MLRREGLRLVSPSDEPEYRVARPGFVRRSGATVEAVQADLATLDGVDKLYPRAADEAADRALLVNAVAGLGRPSRRIFRRLTRVVDTNVTRHAVSYPQCRETTAGAPPRPHGLSTGSIFRADSGDLQACLPTALWLPRLVIRYALAHEWQDMRRHVTADAARPIQSHLQTICVSRRSC